MAVRLSGMVSGLDTDSIVKELMSAQSMKKTKIENKRTKLNWTQEIWKELNTKIYSFYTGAVNKMRTQGNYQTKKVSTSDETRATITATNSAAKGAHTLKVEQLASAQYLTGGVVTTGASGTKATDSTTLSSLGITANTVITITGADATKQQKLTVGSTTKISDFITSCQDAGLNASYDKTQGRIFISSKDSGVDKGFTITTSAVAEDYITAGEKLNELTGYSSLTTTQKAEIDAAYTTLKTNAVGSDDYNTALATLTSYTQTYAGTTYDTTQAATDLAALYDQKADAVLTTAGSGYEDQTAWLASADGLAWSTANPTATEEEKTAAYTAAYAAQKATTLTAIKEDASYESYRTEAAATIAANRTDAINTAVTTLGTTVTTYVTNSAELPSDTSDGNSLLTNIGLGEITGDAVSTTASGNVSGLTVVKATNARIVLDGATMESSSNDMTVNYMTFALKGVTGTNESVSFTVSDNTDQTYDMIKTFVKDYNTLLAEMNKLYDAKTAKGYEPLSADEKESMTDDEVEKWETKIKDSLLRRDNTISTITSSMRSSLMGQVTVDGKKYSLASFGIKTSSDYTEDGKLHIFGDADDDTYSAKTNDLKKALESDPDAVMEVLSAISQNLYATMTKKMESSSISSALTFYNDKSMTTLDTTYKKQISVWEDKLEDMESRYYKQFTAMEKAMSKLQNQSSSLSSLLGTSR